jgi:hypothetical protein
MLMKVRGRELGTTNSSSSLSGWMIWVPVEKKQQ